jgi:hypothetical protein
MTKKRLLLFASLPLTIALTLGVLAMLPPSPGVTKANFDRIEKGMTKAEIEEVFGRKGNPAVEIGQRALGVLYWVEDDGSVAEIIILDDGVMSKKWTNSNETMLQKIRRVLHLP